MKSKNNHRQDTIKSKFKDENRERGVDMLGRIFKPQYLNEDRRMCCIEVMRFIEVMCCCC